MQIKKHAAKLPVKRACAVMKTSASGYYEWLGRADTPARLREMIHAQHVKEVFEQSRGIYGARRIQWVLRRRNIHLSRKKISQLMTMNNLISAAHRRKRVATTDSKHNLLVAPNLLERSFQQTQPNRVWVTDTTYIATKECWLYLTAIIDLYSRRVVGWAIGTKINAALAVGALEDALRRRRPAPGLIVHSDRGSQLASHAFQDALRAAKAIPSMSGKGDCWDNACAESFFHTLKVERIYPDGVYRSRLEAKSCIFAYLLFYNRTRIHSFMDYLSPCDFESQRILLNSCDRAS